MKILMLQGLPASGKSTFSKELMTREPGKWKRINKDLLREMLDCGDWSKEREQFILNCRDMLIREALKYDFNVIVDDTNFSETHINKIKALAEFTGSEFELKFIDTPLYECIERDKKRPNPVRQKVILNMYNKYLRNKIEPIEPEEYLPNCIICDIDGTLAYGNHRSPYDYNSVKYDLVNEKLRRIVNLLKTEEHCSLFIFSGRDDICEKDTLDWLNKNSVLFNYLIMRKTGDRRDDTIVKEEMFNEYINGKYNVLAVFDDRPKVIRMWKNKGLFVCDVNRQDSRIDF